MESKIVSLRAFLSVRRTALAALVFSGGRLHRFTQKAQHGGFTLGKAHSSAGAFQVTIERGRQIRVEDRRMDVAFSADGYSISEMVRYSFDRFDDVFLPAMDRCARI